METLVDDDDDDDCAKKKTPAISASENDKVDESARKRQKVSSEVPATKIMNEYLGYSLQQGDPNAPAVPIDTIDIDSITPQDFFQKYIGQRKPCILNGLPTARQDGSGITITRELLQALAGDKEIQVEKRFHKGERFGKNRTSARQVNLTIRDFLRQLVDDPSNGGSGDGELLYWSTQEDTDDTFNVPCRQLVDANQIPKQIKLAGNLILSSCNLWMGMSTEGASSGLHHDYHDNFYMLLQGQKRFRLFSPDCAPKLAVYGNIERIHPNGRISYVGNETRADGVPLDSQQDFLQGNESSEDEEDDDEEEVVIGKGFDYVSDDDDDDGDDGGGGKVFDENNQVDDFDAFVDSSGHNDVSNTGHKRGPKPNNDDSNTNDGHPDSFSQIDPCRTDTEALHEEFPGFRSCKQAMALVEKGQMLYLPAGWFHEVTSYSNNKNDIVKDEEGNINPLGNCHMALNYWFHPPDLLHNYSSPYQHDFWQKEQAYRLANNRD